MIKYFSKAFKITNENIILTTPLVLFLFVLSIYLGIAQKVPENLISAILLLVTILSMISAFFAGWLYMTKKSVDLSKIEFTTEEEKARASFGLLKEFTAGVGEYFLPFLGAFLIYTAFAGIIFISAYFIGLHFIGKIGLDLVQIKTALESASAMKALISTLGVKELAKLNLWNILFLISTAVFSFLTMLWAPELILKTKNPLIALLKSIVFSLKNLLSAIILFLYISFVNFTVSLLNAFSTIHPIVYFISMLVYFYFVVYIVVLIFLYYDAENQPKSEQQKSDCNSGADGDGQNSSGD